MTDRLITEAELAHRCGHSVRHIQRLRHADPDFPAAIYLGSGPRFSESSVDAYIGRRIAEAEAIRPKPRRRTRQAEHHA